MIKEIGQLKNDRTKCKSNQTTFMPLTSFFALLDNPQPHWKKNPFWIWTIYLFFRTSLKNERSMYERHLNIC
jgi:hypothetical protein